MTTGRIATRRNATRLVLVIEVGLLVAVLYQLCLFLAAILRGRKGMLASATPLDGAEENTMRFLILVPAYNEAAGIEAVLRSLQAMEYPSDRVRTIVIADNCTDDTAERAKTAGAEVLVRVAEEERGKGYALAWALERLDGPQSDFEAVLMIDADCAASPNLLVAMERGFRSGERALQVRNLVDAPLSSHARAIRFAAFALLHTVRPLGKEQLGLSCGLWGTGMAFTRELLQRHPWTALSLAEDAEYHLRLVDGGVRVSFVSEAWVSSLMPTSWKASGQQRARWEAGKIELIRRWTPRLVKSGVSERDLVRIHAGLEHLVPPQSLIAAGSLVSGLVGGWCRCRRAVGLSVLTLVGQLVIVLGGLAFVRAPRGVYRALLFAPELIARQCLLYLALAAGHGPKGWVRTPREEPAETNG